MPYFCPLGPSWPRYGRPASPVPSFPAYSLLPESILWRPQLPPSIFCPFFVPIAGRLQRLLMSAGFEQPPNKTCVLLQTASWYVSSSWRSLSTIRLRVGISLIGQSCPFPVRVISPTAGIQDGFQCPGPELGPASRCWVVVGMCSIPLICVR